MQYLERHRFGWRSCVEAGSLLCALVNLTHPAPSPIWRGRAAEVNEKIQGRQK